MALVKCPTCRAKISNAVMACPRCGMPDPFGRMRAPVPAQPFTATPTSRRRVNPAIWVAAVVLACGALSTLSLIGKASDPSFVTQADLGDAWPFTVEAGNVRCEAGPLLLFDADGKTYALNGTARGWAVRRGWANVDEIWRPDPAIPGARVNIGPMLDRAQATCAH